MSIDFNNHRVVPAQTIEAPRVFGTTVTLEPEDFQAILEKQDQPLVVIQKWGFFVTEYRYLTSYKGLAFYTKSGEQLALPPGTELVRARSMYLPG